MVRITKTMQAKHSDSLSPWIKDFRDSACSIALPLLPQHLATFPTKWPFPRGDLYHWISLLNRFDDILEKFCKAYKLDEGPQTVDFGCALLEPAPTETTQPSSNGHSLESLGYSQDGDRQLIESILDFSRTLLQNCGNRSIYASSAHLNSLLNSTSLSLLESTLLLGSELAQRYQAALKRMNVPIRHINNALLTNHYNIDLDRVLQLAMPFSKTVNTAEPLQPATPATPTLKGKEKALFNTPTTTPKVGTTTTYASDLASMVKGGSGVGSSPKNRNGCDQRASSSEKSWEEWGDVKVTYYPKPVAEAEITGNTPRATSAASPVMPITPTPIRRSSNLGPHGQRASRPSTSEDSPSTPSRASTFPSDDTPRTNFKVIDISSSKLKSTGVHGLLRENLPGLPPDRQYELLTKLRVADALTSSLETRQQVLAVRLLAITNLAYIHSEGPFHEAVLKQDSDEPRRLQLVYQLAELVHPPADGDHPVPRRLQSLALTALDALAAHTAKFQDICSALNTTVNHGVLLYVVRKAVAELNQEDSNDKFTEDDDWRDSVFSLLGNLSGNPRTGGEIVTAGLIPILVEVLSLHTTTAERYHPTILQFLDSILYTARDAFQTLVNANGLDAVSDLIVFEVNSASENASSRKGMLPGYRSASVDYDIPYFQQQTLKWLFKFIHHMMSTAGGYGGNFDRLLRNLIDSSQLLSSLLKIIRNAQCFGSIVWANAVSILNDFINNEPTSFAVIAEAGLSRGLLEAVTRTTIIMPSESKKPKSPYSPIDEPEENAEGSSPSPASEDEDDSEDEVYQIQQLSTEELRVPRPGPLARGIMPTSETINIIPQAFGAICLNTAGMKMFQASKALESFFEIFESPEHVKCMDTNKDLPSNLGSTFDELVRHHPPLKAAIMNSILNMVARVTYLCSTKGEKEKIGAKLWAADAAGKLIVADQDMKHSLVDRSVKEKGKAVETGDDVEMMDVDPNSSITSSSVSPPSQTAPNGSMTPYIAAVATFLAAMFNNSSVRADFSTKGGIEYLLDLSSSPCLSYDFGDGTASRTMQQVVALLSESKPYLAIPSLLRRTQVAANALKPFIAHTSEGSFFTPFVNMEAQQNADVDLLATGTSFAKAFVNVHSLVGTINVCFQTASAYNHRGNSSNFTMTNVSDYYIALVRILGPLLGASLKEEMHLQKSVPDYWKNVTRVKDSGFGEPVADAILGVEPPTPVPEESSEIAPPVSLPSAPSAASATTTNFSTTVEKKVKVPTKTEQDSPSFKNYQTLRYLLSKVSRNISPFFQNLGKALVTKRNSDAFQKYSHMAMAEALADAIIDQLSPYGMESSIENYSYWIGILHVLHDMLIEGASRTNDRPIQTITMVLQAFKDRGGIGTVNHILEVFTSEIRSVTLPYTESLDKSTDNFLRYELSTAGTKNILSLYSQIVNGKNVTEASQTMSLIGGRPDRDRGRSDQFSAPQFLVELRMAVLPTIRRLWESDLIEKGSSLISEKLIDVIRTIANADCEANALKRSDKFNAPAKPSHKPFKPTPEYLATLRGQTYDEDLSNEALYRCNNNVAYALEYCREMTRPGAQRHPVPDGDVTTTTELTTSSSRPRTSTSTGTATPDDQVMQESALSGIVDGLTDLPSEPPAGSQDFGRVIAEFASRNQNIPDSTLNVAAAVGSSSARISHENTEVQPKQITVDDLNEERALIRDNLIDKCLDVINAHGEVTFEIADLITTVVTKSSEASAQRKVVGVTLVMALMSFAGEEDLRKCGKKVAAYAHLLALMLRDKSFYAAAVGELKENLSTLLGFVKLSPNHSAEESSPWIAHILLIIEMLLSDDAKPARTRWTPPKDENDKPEDPVLEKPDPSVPEDECKQLLDAILEILPRIGKDESLALAVLRILVILTRTRSVALVMGEKKNIQRLFVMAKQLAGASSARIQSPLMLILRHIIEDDETIKQIMRAEIKSFFENNRQSNRIDEKHYLRGMAHTALRNPVLFVEVTNEMVKFSRWNYPSAEGQSRHHSALVLKEKLIEPVKKPSDDSVQPTVQATEDLTIQDIKPSTEAVDREMPDAPKITAPEHKLPIMENPDGVIHFLLCELLNYKDVEDKDPTVTAVASVEKPSTTSNSDVSMSGTLPVPDSAAVRASKPPSKPEFKAEDHPIHIYRCFILQCLTELLSSYNRTKIEFINFKRSAPPQAMTPSKPRSSVVNYLLFDLIPVGTLDHPESNSLRKKHETSSCADSVLTALLSKTGEQPIDKEREPYDTEDEPDLLFVRRFVLENILKAYKEAISSTESLDVKYARLLALADLMNHIMHGKDNPDNAISATSQKQLRRIMFEKGFVAALTASIADIDLNFPNAKRAVKYILRPLKTLTTTAVNLSDLALISSTPGQNDEDEIESATSLSEPEDEREETPDLFRNSTLGMFEPGREEDSSSDSDDDDEEMYEGDYDDEMEYEEEGPDEEDGISDEDEEIDGMGPIEGLPGDHGVDVEVIMEDDDDEDDDDEESSGDDEDDEEHDSEDDNARVEIIDEAGNVQQLDDEDILGEWESDDDDEAEEEDYEDQAADEEEQEISMESMDDLGQLVRALGGDEAAQDIIERIEAGGLGGGEEEDDDADRMAGDFDDDEADEGEEDGDEMDEEMFLDQYPNGPGAVSFGWQDEVEPPVIVHRRPRGAGFSPFPFIPGGRHDPLGGTFPSLQSSVDFLRRLENFLESVEGLQSPALQATANSVEITLTSRTNPPVVPEYRSSYRSHRPGASNPRSADDGTNPLLQRNGPAGPARDSTTRAPGMSGWLRAMGGPGADLLDIGLGGGGPFGESAALLNQVIRSLPPMPAGHIARNGHALQFHITTGPGHQIPPDLQALFTMGRPSRYESRRESAEPGSANFFTPQPTIARWLEESKIIFGSSSLERASDLTSEILSKLVPPAVAADKKIKAAEAEKARKLEEEAKKKADEERLAKEAREAEEKIAREKKEAEEREAAERAAAEALAARGAESEQVENGGSNPAENAPEAMDGVETEASAAGEQGEDAPSEDRPIVTTMIRGQPYDITALGIDPEFLAELPEELREEVIMSAVAERRSQAAATGTQPSEIDQEFLDALPDDIRDEIIQQERQDRRRREREERNRQATAANGGAGDMDAASILATFPPHLRTEILMDQDDATLAQLPPEIAEQARAALRDHPVHGRIPSGLARRVATPGEPRDANAQRIQKHPTIQMLDKSGVATLLRLMFISQQGSLQTTLNSVLQNICLNRHNRTEVLSTLLHILQDGSLDMSAVERSFAHLSLKAKQPKDAQPKTPQPLKRATAGLSSLTSATLETSPLMLVQQCLSALVALVNPNRPNPHMSAFFLTEHDNAGTLKRSLSRKGKGKESKAAKYSLNSLLSLLDRDLIMESSSVMESLSMLLNMITAPLQNLQRKQKEAEDAQKSEVTQAEATPSVADTATSVTPPEATTMNNEQIRELSAGDNPSAGTGAVEPSSTQVISGEHGAGNAETSKTGNSVKEPEKKSRTFNPPVIPEHNLKLVINIFVARECSSKTFRETLSTIKNLSAIPGAKAVFGRELISKAQGLGEVILVDLEDLLPQIQKATTGTEIQGVALAKFSPGSSDQNKLLKVLTALDHLFDPKREKTDATNETDEGESSQLLEKQDLLSTLYENPTFGRMWERLSACLAVIRQREHMLNVATILLPLIEALMVVCKNTTLKDPPVAQSQSKEMVMTSPPPESRMESLFFTFTEEHRKILNDLVRHTPKLMSGTFSLLVKNPKVLEFDNKRNYFSRSIHNKAPNTRQSFPPLQLSVRRDQVFHDSFKSLYFQTGDQMKYGKLSIRFHGEEGVDAGGVTREWFQVLSRQMFDPGYALFIPVSSDRTTFHPNQLSSVNEEHLMFFKFIGRIIGKALYEGRVLDCHFSRAVYKRILSKAVSLKDMESLDPDYYKSLIWMLENDITDIITETFSVDNDKFGVVETIDFIPSGRNIPVTEENKHEYVRLMVEWKLTGSVKEQLDEFLKGFHDIIPAHLVAIFNEQELELLISGLPEIDVDDWKSNTEYHNYSASSPQIQWFWRAVRSYDKEERAKLLQFVTGTSKVPLNGFKELEGMNGFSRFNIHRDYGNKDRLPSSHTCFNQLDLPEYESYEALRQQVLTAITAGSEYFGFA